MAALRRLGFDYVFDTNFSADLTIMEEGSEFLERFTHRDRYHWPMFTSCCPGWVRFIKSQFPHYVDCLSTAKSPQQMFGAVAKTYFAEKIGVDPHRMFVVSIMPCMAKKSECALPTMRDACGDPDVDAVLTTREMEPAVPQRQHPAGGPAGRGVRQPPGHRHRGGSDLRRHRRASWTRPYARPTISSPGRTQIRTRSRLSGETNRGKKLSFPFQVPGRSGWRWSQGWGIPGS